MLGFGLCVVGAFMAGYFESLHSTAGVVDGWIIKYAGVEGLAPSASYMDEILAQTNSYIQHDVTAVWAYYLAIGVAVAICGTILVAAGDRKAKTAESRVAGQSQPSQ